MMVFWFNLLALAVFFAGHNGSSTLVVQTAKGACVHVCEDTKRPHCRTVVATAGEVRITRAPGEWALVVGATEAYAVNWDQEQRQATVDHGKAVQRFGRLEFQTDNHTQMLTLQLETTSEPLCRFKFYLMPP